MKKELISELFEKFEDACYNLEGLECWSARDMQEILGYADWRNFTNTIQKAAKACENSGETISDHFVEVNKMIEIGKGGQREVQDIALTRFWLLKTGILQNPKWHLPKHILQYRQGNRS